MVTMMDNFGVEIRVISAGRPQGNGQAEKYVDILKEKMKAIMAELSKCFFFLIYDKQKKTKNHLKCIR